MKKLSLYLVLLAIIAQSCTPSSTETEVKTTAAQIELRVSNYPLQFLAETIAGSDATVKRIRNSETLPVDSITAIQQAGLIFINGATYEKWTMNVSLDEQKIINTTQAFESEYLSSGETFTHSHGDEAAHSHEGTAYMAWLELGLFNQQALAIKDALVKTYPNQKATFEANYSELSKNLMELHEQFLAMAPAAKQLNFAFSHPVYQYFGQSYGLSGESFHWEPSDEMDASHEADFKELNEIKKIDFLVWEGEPSAETRQTLEGWGAKSIVINPSWGPSDAGDYLETMKKNLEELKVIQD